MSQTNRFVAEKDFIETLNRIARNQAAYSVLYVSLSKLKPKNRHPSFIKIISKLFDDLVGAADGNMFVFNNGDFAILGTNITPETVSKAVEKLRLGLVADPMLLNSNISEFAHLYYFPNDFFTLYNHITSLLDTNNQPEMPITKRPVEAVQMNSIVRQLDMINVAEIVKHQSVLHFAGTNNFRVLFQEFFVAVKDLSARYDYNIDLTANKWLFMHLTQLLDKKTISAIQQAEIQNWPNCISLNLHLSTILSPEFEQFCASGLPNHPQIIAEVQMTDVFNKVESYLAAKDRLHAQGNKILLDELIPETLSVLDIKRLEPDYIKLFWNPMMEFDVNNVELKKIIDEFGRDKVILAKCIDDKSVRWGVSYGIRNFQGPYIDNIETAVIRAECQHKAFCDAASCLKRRRLIYGAERYLCGRIDLLEKILGQSNGN